jgi:serine/threonine protein kinase
VRATTRLYEGKEPCPGYRLRQMLGGGGQGEVWEADGPHGELIALKFLASSTPQNVAHELRAIQFVSQMKHPLLTRIDHVWSSRCYVVVAMERAEGSLLDLLEAHQTEFDRPLDPAYACRLLAQAAVAIDFLNSRQHTWLGQRVGVQHCDIKPSNLLLFGDTVKLCDFGLSSAISTSLKPHRRAGTLDYAAPEIFQGRLSERTDQYALAVTYYYLCTGRMPFPPTPTQFSARYIRPAPDLAPVSRAERPVLARALAPAPQDRWPTCGELINRLTAALA